MGMIKKVIKKGIKKLKKVFIPRSEFLEDKKVKEPKLQPAYIGVPAPDVLPYDPWFGDPPKSERTLYFIQKQEQKEVDNIHQVMYDKAVKENPTTLSLDPLPQGGSENFQEGWNSGTGMNQFRG
jgi:hypothetical protein